MDWGFYTRPYGTGNSTYKFEVSDPAGFARWAAIELDTAVSDVVRRARRAHWPQSELVEFPPRRLRPVDETSQVVYGRGYASPTWTIFDDGSWFWVSWERVVGRLRHRVRYGAIGHLAGRDIVLSSAGVPNLRGAMDGLVSLAEARDLRLR